MFCFVFQISSIYKWSFEPKQIKLNFDGVTDACSSGKDIIFQFKGFRVFGKVNNSYFNFNLIIKLMV